MPAAGRVALIGICLGCVLPAAAAIDPGRLADLGLEDLMRIEIEITSVSKRAQRLGDTPAAVTVLTGEDIRRSGATSIVEALRLVPGLEVARINGTTWAVTARGANGTLANKLLVLMDGRSVYSPVFSGSFWDSQDTVLEDIDRIEVIRGPGAVIWGSNAVNGVVNVITKSAAATQGTLLSAAAGPDEQRYTARHGLTLASGAALRVYGIRVDRDDTRTIGGTAASAGRLGQERVGLRLDHAPTTRDRVTADLEVFGGHSDKAPLTLPSAAFVSSETVPFGTRVSGGHARLHWDRALGDGDTVAVDAYFDRARNNRAAIADDLTDTWDLALQHDFGWGRTHRTVWGGGYRTVRYATGDSFQLRLDPSAGQANLANLFAQDEWALIPDRLRLTLGVKVEHSSLVPGANFQPDARLLWNADERQVLWVAASRANRLPSIAELHMQSPSIHVPPTAALPLPTVVTTVGQPGLRPERLTSLQAGYRNQWSPDLSLDAVAYVQRHRDLILATAGPDCAVAAAPGGAYLGCVLAYRNDVDALARGLELAVDWRPAEGWRLQAAANTMDMRLANPDESLPNDIYRFLRGGSPRNQAWLRASRDFTERLQADLSVRRIRGLHSGGAGVPGYTAVDARIGWTVARGLDLSLVGRNLFDAWHREFFDVPFFPAAEVGRTLFARLTWRQ